MIPLRMFASRLNYQSLKGHKFKAIIITAGFRNVCRKLPLLNSKYNCFFFLGLYPWHVEVPGLGVKSELQPMAYTTAMAMPDPSHICDLHCGLLQRWILSPLNEARDRTHILMDTSWAREPWATRELCTHRTGGDFAFAGQLHTAHLLLENQKHCFLGVGSHLEPRQQPTWILYWFFCSTFCSRGGPIMAYNHNFQ